MKNYQGDKRSIFYKERLKEEQRKSTPEENLSTQLHNQVAVKIIEALMKYAHTTDQKSYKNINTIFNKSSVSDWYEFLKQTEGCINISRVLSHPESQTACSFFCHTVQMVNENYNLKANEENDENFFIEHMNFGWAI